MRILGRAGAFCWVVVLTAAASAWSAPSRAFDLGPADTPCCDPSINKAFRDAARAYYSGDKAEAIGGLQSAAESGHPAAQWKLGRMYADGDGVDEDDVKAFDYFNRIITAHGEDAPNSAQAPFVANAFVEIGSYYLTGIKSANLRPDVGRAREIFTYAASYFGDALAQYRLGLLYLEGAGGDRDPRQAARWFLLAARKGQIDAQVELGRLLTAGTDIEPNPVHGLMWLTVALKQARALGRPSPDILAAHEEAFSLAGEDVRRKATALAEQWLADNPAAFATAGGPP